MMNCASPVWSGTETVVRNSSRKVVLTSPLFTIEEPSNWRGRMSEAQPLKSQYGRFFVGYHHKPDRT